MKKRNNLIQARKSKNLKQREVAQIIGILPTSYQNIEYGIRQGSIEVWDSLEKLFQIPQRQLREVNDQSDGNRAEKNTL